MRTAFAKRVDRIQEAEESLDTDYFNNIQRFDKIQVFEKLVKDLETEFKAKTAGKSIKLAELMKDPEVSKTLVELRSAKKKLEKLRFAVESSIIEAREEEEEN